MNIAKVREWIADLRSGKHEQGIGALHQGILYCCLGRGAEVVAGPDIWYEEDMDNCACIKDGEVCYVDDLPKWIADELGIGPIPALGVEEYDLIKMNDDSISFSEIADILEQHLNAYLEKHA